MRMNYAPDYLTPISYVGDPLQRGVQGQPTVMTYKDVLHGAGGQYAANVLQDVSDMYSNIAKDGGVAVVAGDISGVPAGGVPMTNASSSGDCSQYPLGSWERVKCEASNLGSNLNPITVVKDSIAQVFLGALALVFLGLGAWALLKGDK